MRYALAFLFLLNVAWGASPCPHPARSYAAKAAFVKSHPCPATGQHSIHCLGYVIDHIKPLCACGADTPVNMQWQTVAAAKKKDVLERKLCLGK